MEITKYSDIVKRVCALSQRVYSELSNDDNDLIMVYVDQRMKLIWEYFDWPELKRVEKRYYRALYASGTQYNPGTEVYYPTENKYYQALQQTTGNAPTSAAHWYESKKSYSADPWQAGASYVAGDIVEYASDGLTYACHTAHTSSGTLIPTATGGNSRWGLLKEFDQYVGWEQTGENKIGDIIEVWNNNPRTNNKAVPVSYYQSENGIQLIEGPNVVYVEYRKRLPMLLYKTWTTGAGYVSDDVVRYEPSGAEFDLYVANSAHSADSDNDPEESGGPWSKIEIPRDFSAFLSHGAAANLLQVDEKEQLAMAQEQYADQALTELVGRIERQEQQTKQFKVLHR